MRLLSALATALLPLCAQAFSPSGLRFEYQDWELACDNTGTCRAAGYYVKDSDSLPVSVLLTRGAGPQAAVAVQVMLGLEYTERPAYKSLPDKFNVGFNVNGKAYGQVMVDRRSMIGELSAAQSSALLASLTRRSSIEFGKGPDAWQLSDKGAAAVLLKMDEYQERIGTPGALAKKGSRAENSVPPAAPVPTIVKARYAKARTGDERFVRTHRRELLEALRATIQDTDCDDLKPGSDAKPQLGAQRLSATQMLVSAQCSLGHEPNYGYWIVNQKPPFEPELVSTGITDPSPSELARIHKGVGDYWATRILTWDGQRFQLTEESVTGTDRPIKAGGGWELPTVVTNVR